MAAQEGNQSNLKHGGAGAVKAIQRGEPFTGFIHQAEQGVRDDLDGTNGLQNIVENDAVRLETAARLYYSAFIKADCAGEADKAIQYVKMYAWLQSAALRAWAQVKDHRSSGYNPKNVIDSMIREAGDGTDQD
jgi:hypothetical protein